MIRVLRVYGNLKLSEILIASLQKNGRKKLVDIYHGLGIREAQKYFTIQPDSVKYPFLETFIFGMYKYCDYSNKIIIDVGAQTGDSVLYFSYRNAKMIYAFEPVKTNFGILEKNAAQNNVNCKCYNVGLGDSTKNIEVDVGGAMAKPLMSDSLERDIGQIDKLDNFSIRTDIIKIDVEGFEVEVLRGGQTQLKTRKPL